MKRMGPTFFASGLDASRRSPEHARARHDDPTGKQRDGSKLTTESHAQARSDIAETARTCAKEVSAIPRVLPTMAYPDTLTLWSGKREFRLISVTDDEVGNWYVSTHPDSIFVTGLMAARPATDRRYALRNNEFAAHDLNGSTERRVLTSVVELREIPKRILHHLAGCSRTRLGSGAVDRASRLTSHRRSCNE